MKFLKRFLVEEEGQGLVEYSLLLALIVVGVWVIVITLDLPKTINAIWSDVSKALKDTPK